MNPTSAPRRASIPSALVLLAFAFAYACSDADAPTSPHVAKIADAAITFASTSRQISATEYHGCALDSLGKAWCWGKNSNGELGRNSGSQSNVPLKVMGNRTFVTIAAGYMHNCTLTPAGAAYCWGYNGSAQLGGGSAEWQSAEPVLVPGGHKFRQLSAGASHTCAVTVSDQLFCWGDNTNGQLGDGNPGVPSAIERIGAGRSWLIAAAGELHTCALTTDSLAFCWGKNERGQLGTGDTAARYLPRSVRGMRHFARISTRFQNTCALDASGAAWCWGDNSLGQLGINSRTPAFVSAPLRVTNAPAFRDISAGLASVCALATSGVAWCWGWNLYGTNGVSALLDSVPQKVETTQRFAEMSTAIFLSCGRGTNRYFYCWGLGAFGSLGNGADTSSHVPVRVRKLVAVN